MAGIEAAWLLRHGEVDVVGRVAWSSNATFVVRLSRPRGPDGPAGGAPLSGAGSESVPTAGEVLAIYKPERGERPLWDFPSGTLARREVAAYLVSEALGWDLVPETVYRDGPLGRGMVQDFVDHDPDDHYFTLLDGHERDFLRMAVFDVVVNNADRKAGHCVRDAARAIRAIDHGLCFHEQWKLRTVIWEFAGTPLPGDVTADLVRFGRWLDEDGEERLADLLSPNERVALRARLDRIIGSAVLPEPEAHRHVYPWPLV